MEVKGPAMWVFLICYIFFHIIASQNYGFTEAKSLSKYEDLEIEKQLKTINKPAVKIIQTVNGELYGCVDFFKQPAFDHPSLKNHTYNYKMRKTKTNSTGFGYLWENGVGCPIGTVPIRRVTKDDLLSLNSLDDEPRGSWNTTTDISNNVVHYDQHHYAVGRTKNIGIHYHGATMELCVAAPAARPRQFSNSRLHIQMGNDFIETGLTVNPVLYGDVLPRTFVYTKAGGKSCYNSHCDVGMILVRQDFPLGAPLKPLSIRGNPQTHYAAFGLIKDQANGNWWFEFGDNAEEVGFWPAKRFRQSFGNKVEWGGEVFRANQPSPEMGYGFFPVGQMLSDAYAKRITILDSNFHVDRRVNNIEVFSDNIRGYDVIDSKEFKDPATGHVIYFGGPGNI